MVILREAPLTWRDEGATMADVLVAMVVLGAEKEVLEKDEEMAR